MSQPAPLNEYGVSEDVKNRQLAIVATIVFVFLLALLGSMLALAYWILPGSTSERRSEFQIAQAGGRIQRVGTVDVQLADASAAAAGPKSAEEVYNTTCAACHGTGVAGAPKMGDAAVWAARIAQGEAILFKHAIEGFTGSAGVMPAKGGATALSDDEVKAAVVYMANQSGAKFDEIKLPAATTEGADAEAAARPAAAPAASSADAAAPVPATAG